MSVARKKKVKVVDERQLRVVLSNRLPAQGQLRGMGHVSGHSLPLPARSPPDGRPGMQPA